jgi:transcriptional regulator with XRE-family HTH domain
MLIGQRLRQLRKQKRLSQEEIEIRTGLLRCYVSRLENGHAVPTIETSERLARGLETPIYKFFYNGDKPPKFTTVRNSYRAANSNFFGARGKQAIYLRKLREALARIEETTTVVGGFAKNGG